MAPVSSWLCPCPGRVSSSRSRRVYYPWQKEDSCLLPAAEKVPTLRPLVLFGSQLTLPVIAPEWEGMRRLHPGRPTVEAVHQSALVQGHSARQWWSQETPTCVGSTGPVCPLPRAGRVGSTRGNWSITTGSLVHSRISFVLNWILIYILLAFDFLKSNKKYSILVLFDIPLAPYADDCQFFKNISIFVAFC